MRSEDWRLHRRLCSRYDEINIDYSKLTKNNGKKGGGSPLGFNELFNEFKVQENLHSMDEILNAIIDAEGMSFNDLKPIYKEFLLKLAVTLTKDEIFQHSKAIMRKQKKKTSKRNSMFQNKRKKIFKGASGLRMVFRLPFGKEFQKKEKNQRSSLLDFHEAPNAKNLPVSESSVSTSSYDLRQFSPKETVASARTERRRTAARAEGSTRASARSRKVPKVGERTSSEDSDFLTLSNRLGCQNRNSSSGYVSCSECESESCVDRCYCSLKGERTGRCRCVTTHYAHGARSDARTALGAKSCEDCYKAARPRSLSLYLRCKENSAVSQSSSSRAVSRRILEGANVGTENAVFVESLRNSKTYRFWKLMSFINGLAKLSLHWLSGCTCIKEAKTPE
ncbi:hypothetical protein EVAR_23538_1 [Eumeta japonica]|uniref:Uncharacterized protein n=1 Tax=Eumeta variegata TaxID=151549 RepID=A0A4C1WXY6_EUMVA|nr:hypothetical protein EVAR_23538_1 [Eumeta japonica]